MVKSLDTRLNQSIRELEEKHNIYLTETAIEMLKDGITVGMSPRNTFDNAVRVIETKMLALYNEPVTQKNEVTALKGLMEEAKMAIQCPVVDLVRK